jgi:cellobiose phosphorylase
MKYGHFDNEKREYVITNLKTPVRWINYVGTLDFGGFIDQTGGTLICKGDPAFNRITKYIPGLPQSEMNGTAFYIREKTDNSYTVTSPFYVPCTTEPDRFECRVGLSYNRIVSETNGVSLDITFFVPHKASSLVMDCVITNTSDKTKNLDFIPVVEYTHFEALKQFTNADWVPQTMQSKMHHVDGQTVLVQYPFMRRDTQWNFFTSNAAVASYETDRAKFLGSNGYGSWVAPESLQNSTLSDTEALRGDNIAALLHQLGDLGAGEQKRIILQLGQTDKIDDLKQVVNEFNTVEAVDTARKRLADFWDDYLDSLVVDTPSATMNNMLNVHHPKQCYITKNWSRYLSSYQLGLGARGLGMRDSSQDLLGVMSHMPEEASLLMRDLLAIHRPDGAAMHQFYPSTKEANEGDSREMPDRPDFYGDDHLWVLVSLATYIKETGNTAILDEVIPFYTKSSQSKESGTVREHIERALNFTCTHTGAHGLPLLGFADWNDTVNLPTGSESIFNASLYGVALLEMIDLFTYLGETETADRYRGWWEKMKEVVNKEAWDGEWFVRYYDNNGNPVGSHKNDKGKIYVNGQSWPVMAGFATEEHASKALESVFNKLNTENGIKVSWPGYDGFDPDKGGITTYPPGAKENGGIFLHTNPWVMIAEAMRGNGNRAFQYYQQINPAEKDIDIYELEPYCYAQNILSDEHPQSGLARNSWLSGTAAWTYRAATWYILGVRPGFEGLIVDPCIPQHWDGFTVMRKLRGAVYTIKVTNSEHIEKGVKGCTVNGVAVDHMAIPYIPKGESCTVEVTMGL